LNEVGGPESIPVFLGHAAAASGAAILPPYTSAPVDPQEGLTADRPTTAPSTRPLDSTVWPAIQPWKTLARAPALGTVEGRIGGHPSPVLRAERIYLGLTGTDVFKVFPVRSLVDPQCFQDLQKGVGPRAGPLGSSAGEPPLHDAPLDTAYDEGERPA